MLFHIWNKLCQWHNRGPDNSWWETNQASLRYHVNTTVEQSPGFSCALKRLVYYLWITEECIAYVVLSVVRNHATGSPPPVLGCWMGTVNINSTMDSRFGKLVVMLRVESMHNMSCLWLCTCCNCQGDMKVNMHENLGLITTSNMVGHTMWLGLLADFSTKATGLWSSCVCFVTMFMILFLTW